MGCASFAEKKALPKKYTFLAQVLSLERKCFGIRLFPILIVLSVFTISLALGAYARRSKIPEEDKFVVDLDDFYKNRN